ncbi:hypothetical protein [Nocardia sp. XZ_19_369]|uniref:hypothetical protein n=1 Tax=Nocardia sp. XZ_19_369 TaxID=2769487 RepID=UPI0018903A05|nr:hypothetical protein [Nocardia sp. XZ_19_369]
MNHPAPIALQATPATGTARARGVLRKGEKPYLHYEFGADHTGTMALTLTTAPASNDQPVRISLDDTVLTEPTPARSCACPETAETVLDGVHVRHLDLIACAGPRTYAWNTHGTLTTGNLAAYAREWEQRVTDNDHGVDTAAVLHTITGTLVDRYRVHITYLRHDPGLGLVFELSTGDERVIATIDAHT